MQNFHSSLATREYDVERIQLAGAVAIDGVADTGDKSTQLRVVAIRHHRARRPSLRLAGHESEVTHGLAPRAAIPRVPLRGWMVSLQKIDDRWPDALRIADRSSMSEARDLDVLGVGNGLRNFAGSNGTSIDIELEADDQSGDSQYRRGRAVGPDRWR